MSETAMSFKRPVSREHVVKEKEEVEEREAWTHGRK
jgi:hypothetical protein